MFTVLITLAFLAALCLLLAGIISSILAARAEHGLRDDPRFSMLYRKGSTWLLLGLAVVCVFFAVVLAAVGNFIERQQQAANGQTIVPTSTLVRSRIVVEVYVDEDSNNEISFGDTFYSASNFMVHFDGDLGDIWDRNQDGKAEDYVDLDRQRSFSYTELSGLAEGYVDVTRHCNNSCRETAIVTPDGVTTLKLLVSYTPRATLRVSVYLDVDGDRRITEADPLFMNNRGLGTFTVTLKRDDLPNELLDIVDNDDQDKEPAFGVVEREVDARTGYSYVALEYFIDPAHMRERYVDVTAQCSAGCISGVHNLLPQVTGEIRLLVALVEEPITPMPVPAQTGTQSGYVDIEMYVDTDADGQLNPRVDRAYTASDFAVSLLVKADQGLGPQFKMTVRDSDDGVVDGRIRKEIFDGEFYVLSVAYAGTMELAPGFQDITHTCYGPPRPGFPAGCRQGGDLPGVGLDPYVVRVRLLVKEHESD